MPHLRTSETPNKPLTVLQVVPALESGGTERGIIEVGEALVRAGHRSLVISAGGRKVAELTDQGSEHFQRDIGAKSPLTLRHIPWLRSFLNEYDVDVIDIHSRMPGWITFAAWKSLPQTCRPAMISTVHGFYSVNLYSSIMCRGQQVVAVSNSIAEYVRRNYPFVHADHLHVIHRGIDNAQFPRGFEPSKEWKANFFRQYPAAAGKSLLTIAGRITRLKGHLDFVRLVSELRIQDPTIHGLVVGDADHRKAEYAREVKQLVAKLGLDDHVTFTGNRSDIREFYSISRIVLSLSSTPESFGRTVAEALAIGTPVVGYGHGGVAEILAAELPDGAVEPMNFAALVAKTREILIQPEQSYPLPNQFEQTTMLERTIRLYENAYESQARNH